MTKISKLYKTIGLRYMSDMNKPRVLKGASFDVPKATAIFYLTNHKFDVDIPVTTPWLANEDHINIYPVVRLHEPESTFTDKKKNESFVASKMAKNKGWKYLTRKSKMLTITDNVPLILNFNALKMSYEFKGRHAEFLGHYDMLKTLIHHINLPIGVVGKSKIVTVKVPNGIHKVSDYKKFSNSSTSTNLLASELDTYDDIVIFELYKWLNNSDKKTPSLFDVVEVTNMEDTYFLFTYNAGVTMVRMNILYNMLKGIEQTYKISQDNYKTIQKKFILMLHLIRLSSPAELDELDSDVFKGFAGLDMNSTEDLDEEAIDKLLKVIEKDHIVDEHIVEDVEGEEEIKPTLEDLKKEEPDFNKSIDNLLTNGTLTTAPSDNEIKKVKEILAKQKPILEKLKVTNIVVDKEKAKFKKLKHVKFEGLMTNTARVQERQYLDDAFEKHIVKSFYNMQHSGVIVHEMEKEVVEDIQGSNTRYKIVVKPIGGKQSTIYLDVPTIDDEGFLKTSMNQYRLRKQSKELPIEKIDTNTVALSSNYGKLFIKKGELGNNNISSKILSIVRANNKAKIYKYIMMGEAEATPTDAPAIYKRVSEVLLQIIFKDGTKLIFNHRDRGSMIKKTEKISDLEKGSYKWLLGVKGTKYLYLNKKGEVIYDNGSLVNKDTPTLLEFISVDENLLPLEYVTMKVLGKRMSIGLILSYYFGLEKLMKTLKVKFIKSNDKKTPDNHFTLKFRDINIHVEKSNISKAIIGGLTHIKELGGVDFITLNNNNHIGELFALMEIDQRYVKEMTVLNEQFVDSTTADILKYIEEPVMFKPLLIRACELFFIDYKKKSYEAGYERITGMLNKLLSESVKEFRHSGSPKSYKFQIPPYALSRMLVEDPTTMLVEDINPIAYLRQSEEVTFTGFGGRVKEAITGKDRAYVSSSLGVISEATKDSGEVGINTYMSANPQLDNIYGIHEEPDVIDDLSTIYSTSLMAIPGSLGDDPKRRGFISIMNGHLKPMENSIVLPMRTGMESSIPLRMPDKYCVSAKEAGIVIKLTKGEIQVKLKSGSIEKYKLNSWTSRDEGGTSFLHTNITNLKVGDKFDIEDTIRYDKMFFAQDVMNFKRVCLKMGALLRVMMVEKDSTREDSFALAKSIREDYSTYEVKTKIFKFDATDNISNMVKVDEDVKVETVLFNKLKVGDDSNNMSNESKSLLDTISTISPKAKVKGKIIDIQCLYNIDFDDDEIITSEQVKKIIDEGNKRLKNEYGSKFTGKVTSSFSLNGSKCMEGELFIKILISKLASAVGGDKFILGAQLKATIGDIFDEVFRTINGSLVEGKFSTNSVEARIVGSFGEEITVSTIMEEGKRVVIDMYDKLQ